jgi:hypothetical protein
LLGSDRVYRGLPYFHSHGSSDQILRNLSTQHNATVKRKKGQGVRRRVRKIEALLGLHRLTFSIDLGVDFIFILFYFILFIFDFVSRIYFVYQHNVPSSFTSPPPLLLPRQHR